MLPYNVSAEEKKYMVCLLLYLKDVRGLPDEQPYVNKNFMEDHFTVHRRTGSLIVYGLTYGPGANV